MTNKPTSLARRVLQHPRTTHFLFALNIGMVVLQLYQLATESGWILAFHGAAMVLHALLITRQIQSDTITFY